MASSQRFGPSGSLLEQWSTGAQPGDPLPVGYTSWDALGVATTRALTAQEATRLAAVDASLTAGGNQATIQQQAQAALAVNRAFVNAAKPGTAAAQASAAYDQAVRLSQQMNGALRLLLNQFDATN